MRFTSLNAHLTLGLGLLLLSAGCKTTGEYVNAESLPSTAAAVAPAYVLQVGDTISIRVWNQDSISTKARVRPDGKISMPFIDDVTAAGLTPTALARVIQAKLKDFIVNPVVAVSLDEPRPLVVAVMGEVVKAGNYPLESGSGVLAALATAGGLTPFADRDRIIVIRQQPDGSGVTRIRFTYSGLTQAGGAAASFRLQGGDVVVVE